MQQPQQAAKATPPPPPPRSGSDNEILEAGQKSGQSRTFSWVYENDEGYVNFILGCTRLTNPQLLRFKNYCVK